MGNVKSLLTEQAVTWWRHKWIALAACWLVCVAGWSAVMVLPRSYQSDARAFVDVNGLLTPLLKGLVVDTTADQSTDYLRQTLLSRPNLMEVIHFAQLDNNTTAAQKDDLIVKLQNEVAVKAQGKSLFTISYVNPNPVVAKSVVESLLTIFAEKAASSNRVEMEKAHKFLDDQIATYQDQLRAAEQRRADFRKKYAEVLADPISGAPRLGTLQQQAAAARQAYNQAVLTRDSLQAQLKQIPQFHSAAGPQAQAETVGTDGKVITGTAAARVAQAKAVLASLRLKYTDQHPDVIAARNEVADLESAAASTARTPTPPTGEEQQQQSPQVPNPTYEQIRLKIVDAETALPAMKQRLDQANADFERVKVASADIPDVDAKAKDLDRDYDVIKKNHDELLVRRESANLSQAADDQADRTQFRIVDPPQVPFYPSFPNLPVMFSIVLLLGIGAGLSLPTAIELVRSTFSSVVRLRGLGLPVIGAVTFVRRPGATRGLVASTVGAFAVSGALLAVYGTLMILSIGANRGIL
jgi:polysaccharide chain length determinant protein (PEP-CTERM system associated)